LELKKSNTVEKKWTIPSLLKYFRGQRLNFFKFRRDSNPDQFQDGSRTAMPPSHSGLFIEIGSWVTLCGLISRLRRYNFSRSTGADVMITIFCDFCQFSEKKLAFFSKANDMIKFLKKTSCSFEQKWLFFGQFFWRKYL
jgi:hypothetical protein